MAKMDGKAGNKGDQLKHALILEILKQCGEWSPLTYAETHSGAAVYRGESQENKESKDQHIRNLKRKHDTVVDVPNTSQAGGQYFESLQNWWAEESQQDQYPGSVLQAVTFLRQQMRDRSFVVRATEADYDAHRRLADALRPFNVNPRHSGFQDQINWLCENDRIVLVVDPFAIVGHVPQDKCDAQLNDGKIDLGTLRKMLDYFPIKSNAVVMLWTSYGQQNRVYKQPVEDMLSEWTLANRTSFRRYHDNASHNTYVIGFGNGKRVVEGLPSKEDWDSSWLQGTIREL